MRCILGACAFVMLAGSLNAAESSLPSWRDGERGELEKKGWVAGGLLLEKEPEPEETEEPALVLSEPAEDELAADAAEGTQEIPSGFLDAYFDIAPDGFLIDPQGLLSSRDARDRRNFLEYHSSDSSIDLFVYLFAAGQEIPAGVRDEEAVERFFNRERSAVVVYYFLGEPQRSRLLLGPGLADVIPEAERRRALDSSIMQALARTDAPGQFDAFLVQMSIRLYWMERMLARTGEAGQPDQGGAPAALESTAAARSKGEAKAAWKIKLQEVSASIVPWLPVAGGTVLLLMVVAALTWWRRATARLVFPDLGVEPRLGGDHAAGVGAVISFASAALPPASQRDQMPDYLRRM